MKRILLLLCLFWPSLASADFLGCFEPSTTVSGYRLQLSAAATGTPTTKILNPTATVASPTSGPTSMTGGTDNWIGADYAIGASTAYGLWQIRYEAVVSGSTLWVLDAFELRAQCPLKPTVAGRTLDVATTGAVGGVSGDVAGKVLGGGGSTLSGTGVRAVDGSGNAIAPAVDTTRLLVGMYTISVPSNADTRTIPMTETTIVTVDDQFIKWHLMCGAYDREVISSDDNTTDTLTIETGNPFPVAPTSTTCYLMRPSL